MNWLNGFPVPRIVALFGGPLAVVLAEAGFIIPPVIAHPDFLRVLHSHRGSSGLR